MMKLAIMQPYFFPYLGYWQLIDKVDRFVIYDDVNYIKKGWINRNRLLEKGTGRFFNVYMEEASQNKKINEISRLCDDRLDAKFLRRIESCYGKAPFYSEVFPIIKRIILNRQSNLACYLSDSLIEIADYLEIDTEFIISSHLDKDNNKKGEEKILHICKILQADSYYNAIGGIELYSTQRFKEQGIDLYFIKTEEKKYKQYENTFVPNLSIIDVLMFNGKCGTRELLESCTVIKP